MWSIGYRIVCGGVSGFNAPSVLVIELLGGDGNCGSIESYVRMFSFDWWIQWWGGSVFFVRPVGMRWEGRAIKSQETK